MSTDTEKRNGGTSLLATMGNRLGVEPAKLYKTLQATAFKEARSEEQFIALLVVANQYGLNPLTKELYAFPDSKSGGVVPVVGVDGWSRIINSHPHFDGMEFREAESHVRPDGAKPCPEWIECVIYRKDRTHAVVAREYLDECYRNTSPWKSHTKRMLRHKAMIQAARLAFGFGGIYDPDEAERIVESDVIEAPRVIAPAVTNADRALEALGAVAPTAEPPIATDSNGEVIDEDDENIGVGAESSEEEWDEALENKAPQTDDTQASSDGSKSQPEGETRDTRKITNSQRTMLFATARDAGVDEASLRDMIRVHGEVESTKDLERWGLDLVLAEIKAYAEKRPQLGGDAA